LEVELEMEMEMEMEIEVLVAVVRQVVMRVEMIHFEKRTIVMLPE
jgi:hypothetical protein